MLKWGVQKTGQLKPVCCSVTPQHPSSTHDCRAAPFFSAEEPCPEQHSDYNGYDEALRIRGAQTI